jgi:hypothetical protein
VAYYYFRVAVSYNVESGKDTHTREVAGSMLAHATRCGAEPNFCTLVGCVSNRGSCFVRVL